MKTLIILVILSILLSSCYSYKNVQNIPSGSGVYKISDESKRICKIRIIEIRKDSLVVIKNGKQVTIANTEFRNPQKRKYSAGKTVALYVGGLVVSGAIIIAVLANGLKHMGHIQSPP